MPPVFCRRSSVYHQFVMETPERDRLKSFLDEKGIGTGIYYPLPLHQHGAWKTKGMPDCSLPESERYARENFAIPVFSEMTDEEVGYVVTAVRKYFD